MLAGLTFGIGNTFFGNYLTQYGLYSSTFTGPIGACFLILYRLIEACQTKRRTGNFVDYANSNYWCLDNSSSRLVTQASMLTENTDNDF